MSSIGSKARPLSGTCTSIFPRIACGTAFEPWRMPRRLSGVSSMRRKGELSPAAIDDAASASNQLPYPCGNRVEDFSHNIGVAAA
jgi:hypothetical protein